MAPQVLPSVVGSHQTTRKLGHEDRRQGELGKFELRLDALADLVDQEAQCDPDQRQRAPIESSQATSWRSMNWL